MLDSVYAVSILGAVGAMTVSMSSGGARVSPPSAPSSPAPLPSSFLASLVSANFLVLVLRALPELVLLAKLLLARKRGTPSTTSLLLISCGLWFSIMANTTLGGGHASLSEFVGGVVYFRAAHVAYNIAFAQGFHFRPKYMLLTAAALVAVVPVLHPALLDTYSQDSASSSPESRLLPFTITTYVIALLLLPLSALSGSLHCRQTAFSGALFFILSDILLAFGKPLFVERHLQVPVMYVLYYIAQYYVVEAVVTQPQQPQQLQHDDVNAPPSLDITEEVHPSS